jgi:hypothetical protein
VARRLVHREARAQTLCGRFVVAGDEGADTDKPTEVVDGLVFVSAAEPSQEMTRTFRSVESETKRMV